ncbi:hypothetical protein B0H14DRAFT_2860103 [Mycena olivaceomarginata]|nr:hypothetical protein B0H14DRAFT_2860103 [Mycena olivaceomarginata]
MDPSFEGRSSRTLRYFAEIFVLCLGLRALVELAHSLERSQHSGTHCIQLDSRSTVIHQRFLSRFYSWPGLRLGGACLVGLLRCIFQGLDQQRVP